MNRLLKKVSSILLISLFINIASDAHGSVEDKKTWLFTWGARYSNPQIASASVSIIKSETVQGSFIRVYEGNFLQLEPGVGGGKVSIGHGAVAAGEEGFYPAFFAIAIKGSYLRTWGSPWGRLPNQNFLGTEADFTYLFIKTSVGYFWRTNGSGFGDEQFISLGAGIGF